MSLKKRRINCGSYSVKKKNRGFMKKIIFALAMLGVGQSAMSQKLETVYSDNTYQFTGVAISAKGRLFVTYPRWSDTYRYGVVEVMPDGSAKPYPDAATNEWQPGESGLDKWVCVQTAYIDEPRLFAGQ